MSESAMGAGWAPLAAAATARFGEVCSARSPRRTWLRGQDAAGPELAEEAVDQAGERGGIRRLGLGDDQDVELAALAALREPGDHVAVDVPAVARLLGEVLVADPARGVEAVDLEPHAVLVEPLVLLDAKPGRFESPLQLSTGGALFHARIVRQRGGVCTPGTPPATRRRPFRPPRPRRSPSPTPRPEARRCCARRAARRSAPRGGSP